MGTSDVLKVLKIARAVSEWNLRTFKTSSILASILGCKGLKKGGKSFFHEHAEDEEHKSTQDVVKPVLSSHP